MAERMVKIDNLGKLIKDELIIGLKNFFMPVAAVATAVHKAITDKDPYRLRDLETVDNNKKPSNHPKP
jgi:hypothetical protein